MAERYTAQEVVEAIRGTGRWKESGASGGLISLVADRLGCNRRTVYRYRNKYASVREALDEERERTLDFTEGELIHMIRDRSHPGHTTAVLFYLKTIGKGRGYVERMQVEEYLEREMEYLYDKLERRLAPDVFREVCGILAEDAAAGGGVVDPRR
jgi:hypothetical protein